MSENGLGKKILKNVLSSWTASIIRAVMGLIMVPFLLSHLGKEGYGIIALFMVIISCVNVADLGLRSALGRELSEKNATNDKSGFEILSSTAFCLYIAMAVVMSIVLWLATPALLGVFKVTGEHYSLALWLLPVFGFISIILAFTIPVFSAGISSFMRQDIVINLAVFSSILSNVLLFIIIPFFSSHTIIVWAIITLSGAVVNLIVIRRVYKKICYDGRISLSLVTPRFLRPLFKLGGYMYTLQMTNTLSEKSNPLIISSFFGPAGVVMYQSAGKVCLMLRPIVLTLANQLYPLTTECHVRGQGDRQRKILLSGSKYTMLLGVLVSTGLFVFAEPFCRLWLFNELGADYLIVSYIIQLLAVFDLTAYAQGTQWSLLLGMKKLKVLVWVQVPSAVINVMASIYLVGYTDLGIAGAVYPTIVLNILRLPLLMWYVGKQVKASFGQYLTEAYLRPCVCLVITYLGAKISYLYVDCHTWLGLMIAGLLMSLIWAVSLFFVGINTQEKSILIQYASKLLSRVKA